MLNLFSIHEAIAIYLLVPLALGMAAMWLGRPQGLAQRQPADIDRRHSLC